MIPDMKSKEDLENDDLENFEEAIKAVNTALQPAKIPESTKVLLNDAKCLSLDNNSEDFWIMARGLKGKIKFTSREITKCEINVIFLRRILIEQ